jgi:hypothetical protein
VFGLYMGIEGGIAEVAFAAVAGEVASVFVAPVPPLSFLIGYILAVEFVRLGA